VTLFWELARFGAKSAVDRLGEGRQASRTEFGKADGVCIHQHGRNSAGVGSLRPPTNQEWGALD
jgi:hypothetical protein